jgi:hypothetical protein
VIALQALWLLPVLDARAEMIIQGETPPRAPWHTLYIAIEVLKLLALLVVGWLALVATAIELRSGRQASRPG